MQALQTRKRLHKLFPERDPTCVLCTEVETIDHLLLYCEFTSKNLAGLERGLGYNFRGIIQLGLGFPSAWIINDTLKWHPGFEPEHQLQSCGLLGFKEMMSYSGKKADWQETFFAALLAQNLVLAACHLREW